MLRFNALMTCIMMILSVSVASAQSLWALVEAQSLSDVTGAGEAMRYEAMSADGTMVAWGQDGELCIYTFADGSKNCTPTPDTFAGFGKFSNLSWSLDGKSLVFTEDFFMTQSDSDIWSFDVASGTIENRTDDQFSGTILEAQQPQPLVDTLPTWNPANDDLYFFRLTPPMSNNNLSLERLSGAEPEEVRNLSHNFPILSIYQPAVISPDGKRMAIIVAANDLEDRQSGVWILNFEDSTFEQVLTIDDLNLGLPEWAIHPGDLPKVVQWADNSGLVVWALNEPYITQSIQAAYYVDLSTKEVTPLADFTDVPDVSTLYLNDDDTTQPIYRMPRAGVVTPDGSCYLYLSFGIGSQRAYLWSQKLPPDGSAPTQIGIIDPFDRTNAADAQPAISADGQHALLYGYWLTLEQDE